MIKHIYTVKENDNLWDIAKAKGTTVERLLELNPDIHNPNLIYPGQKIRLVASPSMPKPPPLVEEKSSAPVWWIAGLMAAGAALLALFSI